MSLKIPTAFEWELSSEIAKWRKNVWNCKMRLSIPTHIGSCAALRHSFSKWSKFPTRAITPDPPNSEKCFPEEKKKSNLLQNPNNARFFFFHNQQNWQQQTQKQSWNYSENPPQRQRAFHACCRQDPCTNKIVMQVHWYIAGFISTYSNQLTPTTEWA